MDASDNLLSGALDVSDLQLVTLDVSDNNALTELNCKNNRLVDLVLFNNPALEILDCSFNQLDVLDLSGLASSEEEEEGGLYNIEFRLTGSGSVSVLGETFTVNARYPTQSLSILSPVALNDSIVFTHVSGNPSLSLATISKYVFILNT